MRSVPFVYKAAATASIGGILFGYDLGVISGALPSLQSSLQLTSTQVENIVSFLYVGSIMGSLVGGYLCDRLGRRFMILMTDLLFLVGALTLALAPGYRTVLMGRVVVGMAVSISGIADVSYLTEIAPSESMRGSLISCNEACVTLGFLLAYLISYLLSSTLLTTNHTNNDDDDPPLWRILFGLSGIVALVQLVGIYQMPESPIWLFRQGKHAQATAAHNRIHGHGSPYHSTTHEAIQNEDPHEQKDIHPTNHTDNIHGAFTIDDDDDDDDEPDENDDHVTQHETTHHDKDHKSQLDHVPPTEWEDTYPNTTGTGTEIGSTLRFWRQGVVAAFLAVAQQFCGHVNILNFAPEIFGEVFFGQGGTAATGDEEEKDAKMLAPTLLLGVCKFLLTLLVIWKIEVFGRRSLLLTGIGIITVSLMCLIIAFSNDFSYKNNASVNHVDATNGTMGDADGVEYSHTVFQQVLAVIGCMGVVSGYAISYGPLVWVVTSELFPSNIRGRALGASTILTSGSAAFISYTFLSGQDWLGPSAPFVFYFVMSLLSWIFAAISIPDTRDADADLAEDELHIMMGEMW
eukprot:CAMPEP_0198305088 /NCGR_PEP_ID=MMETSP1449-20131203/57730_1 /TAXON_ID=420275 /ORGANISM="Attheya septentrionalis, Strain CCMP2084" /LENGTH=573 /DNA_ID=CAMNT_0044007619 /DNA_START=39 /DNA_END=1757 /DNA_ORIENTATION=-